MPVSAPSDLYRTERNAAANYIPENASRHTAQSVVPKSDEERKLFSARHSKDAKSELICPARVHLNFVPLTFKGCNF